MTTESNTSKVLKWLAGIAAALIVSGTAPFWWKYIAGSPPSPQSSSPPSPPISGPLIQGSRGTIGYRNADGIVTVLPPPAMGSRAPRPAPTVVPDENGMVAPPPKR